MFVYGGQGVVLEERQAASFDLPPGDVVRSGH